MGYASMSDNTRIRSKEKPESKSRKEWVLANEKPTQEFSDKVFRAPSNPYWKKPQSSDEVSEIGFDECASIPQETNVFKMPVSTNPQFNPTGRVEQTIHFIEKDPINNQKQVNVKEAVDIKKNTKKDKFGRSTVRRHTIIGSSVTARDVARKKREQEDLIARIDEMLDAVGDRLEEGEMDRILAAKQDVTNRHLDNLYLNGTEEHYDVPSQVPPPSIPSSGVVRERITPPWTKLRSGGSASSTAEPGKLKAGGSLYYLNPHLNQTSKEEHLDGLKHFQKFQVWRDGEWKNVSSEENMKARTAINLGLLKFLIQVRGLRYSIDLGDPRGGSQTNIETGLRRPLKIITKIQQDQSEWTARVQLKREIMDVPLPNHKVEEDLLSPRKLGPIKPDEIHSNLIPMMSIPSYERAKNIPSAYHKMEDERKYHASGSHSSWNVQSSMLRSLDVTDSELKLSTIKRSYLLAIGKTRSFLSRERLRELCHSHAVEKLDSQDDQLVNVCLASVFKIINLSGNGRITLPEWTHYHLLLSTAPNTRALEECNEKLKHLSALPEYIGCLHKILQVFEQCQDALALRKAVIKTAISYWHSFKLWNVILEESDWLEDGEEDGMNYYDYLNILLNRRKADIELWMYDLSKGKAKWASPFLFGKQVDGIWHTSIVVFEKEYWCGGECFESMPGRTPFGEPTRKISIGTTMRSRKDLWDFMRQELVHKYKPETYDAINFNCNNFSNDICMFLNHDSLQSEILNQSKELAKSAIASIFPRRLLNMVFGNFTTGGSTASVMESIETQELLFQKLQIFDPIKIMHEDHITDARVMEKFNDSDHSLTVRWYEPPWIHQGGDFKTATIKMTQVLRVITTQELYDARL